MRTTKRERERKRLCDGLGGTLKAIIDGRYTLNEKVKVIVRTTYNVGYMDGYQKAVAEMKCVRNETEVY